GNFTGRKGIAPQVNNPLVTHFNCSPIRPCLQYIMILLNRVIFIVGKYDVCFKFTYVAATVYFCIMQAYRRYLPVCFYIRGGSLFFYGVWQVKNSMRYYCFYTLS